MICPRCGGSGFFDWSLDDDDYVNCDYPGCVDGRVYDGPVSGAQSDVSSLEPSVDLRNFGSASSSRYE